MVGGVKGSVTLLSEIEVTDRASLDSRLSSPSSFSGSPFLFGSLSNVSRERVGGVMGSVALLIVIGVTGRASVN